MRPALLLGSMGALVTLALLARADEPAPPVVIAPGDEVAGAVASGKATIASAQKLAKAKKYAEALPLFEQAALQWPAAEHDCYLSLAYLRVDDLTRAQLWYEVARRRNAERPSWCTGSLSKQLDAAVRTKTFVPLTINVVPPDAVIEVDGVALRGLDLVWLAPGTHGIVAHADGMLDGATTIDLEAPSGSVTLTLEPPEPDPVVTPDAATVEPAIAPDAGPFEPVPATPVVDAPGPVRWPAYASFAVGAIALGYGGLSHASALDHRATADGEFPTSPAYAAALDDFEAARTRALAGYALGTIAVGFGAYWWLTHGTAEDAPRVGGAIGRDGASVNVGWTFEEAP